MFQILRGSDEFNVVWSYTADKDRNASFISAWCGQTLLNCISILAAATTVSRPLLKDGGNTEDYHWSISTSLHEEHKYITVKLGTFPGDHLGEAENKLLSPESDEVYL